MTNLQVFPPLLFISMFMRPRHSSFAPSGISDSPSTYVGHPVLFFPSPAAARGRDPSRGCFQSQRGTEEEERQTTFLSRSHISKRPIPRLELRKLSCVPPLLDRQMFSRVGIHPTRNDNNKSWRRIGPLGEIFLFGRGEAEEGRGSGLAQLDRG